MHRLARILSTTLITAGVIVLLDAGITLLWEEPVSAAYASLKQGQASDELSDLESEFPASGDLAALHGVEGDAAQAKVLADLFEKRVQTGDALGRLQIDRIGLNTVFLQGTATGTLQRGPGHYPTTQLPGQAGTVAIAGHRTTYGAPFRTINEIRDGDEIRLVLPYAAFNYEVEKHEIVDPGDVRSSTGSATSDWSSPPATRSTARRNAGSYSRGCERSRRSRSPGRGAGCPREALTRIEAGERRVGLLLEVRRGAAVHAAQDHVGEAARHEHDRDLLPALICRHDPDPLLGADPDRLRAADLGAAVALGEEAAGSPGELGLGGGTLLEEDHDLGRCPRRGQRDAAVLPCPSCQPAGTPIVKRLAKVRRFSSAAPAGGAGRRRQQAAGSDRPPAAWL